MHPINSMNSKKIILSIVAVVAFGFNVPASTYFGNGNTSFNGAIGNGSLTLTDNGTTISGSLTTAAGLSGNAFVLYIQTAGGGFSTTSGFNDNGDQLRTAISQYNGVGNQSILNFSSGFAPNYALALQPGSGINFGGLWQLANGGANSLPFDTSVNLSPTGSDAAGTYNFSFSLASIGLTAGQSFELFGMQVSTTGYSSAETIGGNVTGTLGYGGTQTETSFSTYVTVPEPSTMVLGAAGMATLLLLRRRR
jgi:hypothetical protein